MLFLTTFYQQFAFNVNSFRKDLGQLRSNINCLIPVYTFWLQNQRLPNKNELYLWILPAARDRKFDRKVASSQEMKNIAMRIKALFEKMVLTCWCLKVLPTLLISNYTISKCEFRITPFRNNKLRFLEILECSKISRHNIRHHMIAINLTYLWYENQNISCNCNPVDCWSSRASKWHSDHEKVKIRYPLSHDTWVTKTQRMFG